MSIKKKQKAALAQAFAGGLEHCYQTAEASSQYFGTCPWKRMGEMATEGDLVKLGKRPGPYGRPTEWYAMTQQGHENYNVAF